MPSAIKVLMTRPTVDVEWPFVVFLSDVQAAATEYRAIAGENNKSWGSAEEPPALSNTVYHCFTDATALATHLSKSVPWWKNDANASEVDAYCSANGITVVVSEVTNPDTTGMGDITNL